MRERIDTLVLTPKRTFIKGWTTVEDGRALRFQVDKRIHPHLDDVLSSDTNGLLVKYDLWKSHFYPRRGLGQAKPSF